MGEKLTETFGDRLRAARLRKGLSQTTVCQQTGHKGHAAANNWDNSYNFPELASLVIVAELLDVSIDYLVWGNDVANGIGARIRKVPPILRESLVMRIHDEINRAEEAAKQLPEAMRAEHLRDADDRVKRWADANLRKPATGAPPKKAAKRSKNGTQ